MSRKRKELPVMIGKHLNKGILVSRSPKLNGFDLIVVWLNKNYETGKQFEMEDIDEVDQVIHFCDRESVEQTADALKWILKQWKVENEDIG